MKIIELLNKIANGEEVPKKIRLGNNPDIFYYKKDINSYKSCNGEYLISEWLFNSKRLNEEVEILEEEKKIEHIENYVDFANSTEDSKFDYLYEMISRLIDEVNKLKDDRK